MLSTRISRFFIGLSLLVTPIISLPACAPTEEENKSSDSKQKIETAQENCRRLLNNYCLKIEDCALFTSRTECETTLRQQIDCADAVDTDPDLDDCFAEIAAIDCDAGTDLPASCKGVIIINEQAEN
jgi:hypothetical protein